MTREVTPTRVLLVRHGQSTWNAQGRWQGWADSPLSEIGEEQARAAAKHLPEVEAVVSSDLVRARRTAELICEGRDLPPAEIYRGLRERGVGEFEGMTNPEIAERFPHLIGSDGSRPLDIPGAEPIPSVIARVVAALTRVARSHEGRAVLAVSHGGVIRALERHLGIEPAHVSNLGGRWIEVDARGGLALGERVRLFDRDEAPVTIPRQL